MMDREHNESVQIGQPAPSCHQCRSEDADLQKFRCRACGAEWLIEHVFTHSSEQYRRAEQVLHQERLLVAFARPHVSTYGYVSVSSTPGKILIRSQDQSAVAKCLEESGIRVPYRGVPFIDREHPFCLFCEADVSQSQDGLCPNCRKPFVWLDELDDLFEAKTAAGADCGKHESNASGQSEETLPPPELFQFSRPSNWFLGLARWYCDAISFFIVFIAIVVLATTWTAFPVVAVSAIVVCVMAIYLRRPIRHWLHRVEDGSQDTRMRWPE